MRWIWLPLVLLVFADGCGGDSAPPPPAPPPQKDGHLSVAEYRAIVTEYRKLHRLQQGRDDPSTLARGRRACAQLRSPRTLLVARVRTDCDNAIAFFAALRDLEAAGSDCTTGSERDRIVCGRNRYARMADAIKTTTQGGIAINTELRRRGIRGLCADSIGMTQAHVAAYRRAEQAARDAVDAISVADVSGFERAQAELTGALDARSSGDPLAGIERACRPPAVKPAPKKSRPRPLPRVPDDSGIKA